jgi:tetratricopeptide (TPR) repeat protein
MVDDLPRVSVIVRTMGRPCVADALASIALQRHPSVEVVLVDASGGALASPPERCGPFPVTFVRGDRPRSRPVAANAGLDAAGGDLVVFLDEDDLFLPDHLSGLASALAARPDCVAAYSAAREVDRDGRVLRVRAQPFGRFLLFRGCFLANCSVLFRRSAAGTCRFDEQFDVLEDWDFWLQLSRVGPFLFVPQETAVYRAEAGTSGTGALSNRDTGRAMPLVQRLAAKWSEDARSAGRSLDAMQSRAIEALQAGRLDEALRTVTGMLALHPAHAGALGVRGNLMGAAGRADRALDDFLAASREDPTDPAHLVGAAQALERLGRAHEAAGCYEKALALAPGSRAIASRLENLRSGSRA